MRVEVVVDFLGVDDGGGGASARGEGVIGLGAGRLGSDGQKWLLVKAHGQNKSGDRCCSWSIVKHHDLST